ncbi:1,4-beta-xylanase [Ereboglobus luteus]|uniref:1,4-beta-xylanase n=2 Tax=Ereboglobus luteus TaxID=1796921 RepID=A0A2U8E755_9BACT|nr:1,4-beta-xylanase [Ereboglobus luteus]
MSPAYWEQWNPKVQEKIDRDIDKNRKADAIIKLPRVIPAGADIKIEQVTHDFVFGAHIFNFNQLGTPERNRKYKELYGSLFNSATVPFYWKKFEMQPGKPRFKGEIRDTEAYWNEVTQNGDPKKQPHWRRPATDPIVEFCESKGVRMLGHPLVWGIKSWHHPEWLFTRFCPEDEKEKIKRIGGAKNLHKLPVAEIEKMLPVYTSELNRHMERRIAEIAKYYGNRLQSWDVVNESVKDFKGTSVTGNAVCSSAYGVLLPGDYTHKAYAIADRVFPKSVLFNINETTTRSDERYLEQVMDLRKNGSRIDILGVQFHLFNPQHGLDIAEGKQLKSPKYPVWPDQIWTRMDTLSKADLPIHLSEITITAPGDDARGQEIQAIMARNLYRMWFSIKNMMGITWWNVVDGCGVRGEPTTTGLFTRDMQPKPSFHALNQLINHEWKTNMTIKNPGTGTAAFRGFKGKYKITWRDASGRDRTATFHLKTDGDSVTLE